MAGDASDSELLNATAEMSTFLETYFDGTMVMHHGALGLAWALAHVTEAGAATALDRFDDHLRAALSRPAASLAWDLAGGVSGVAIYAAARADRGESDVAAELGNHVVRILEEKTKGGESLWALGRHVPVSAGGVDDDAAQTVDCGMAHGVPGVAVALGLLAERRVAGAAGFLAKVMAWMEARWLPAGAANQLPRFASQAGPGEPAPVGWCYGDLGAIVGLLNATRRAGLPEEALWARASACVAREVASAQFADAGLCHGAMGVAHLFHRLFLASREQAFADAAAAYTAQAFAYFDPDDGMGGFGSARSDAQGRSVRMGNPRLLSGSVGVVLAMHALETGSVPSWDQCLGIDIPVRP